MVARGYYVIAHDARFFGTSSSGDDALPFDGGLTFASDAIKVLDALSVIKAVFICQVRLSRAPPLLIDSTEGSDGCLRWPVHGRHDWHARRCAFPRACLGPHHVQHPHGGGSTSRSRGDACRT